MFVAGSGSGEAETHKSNTHLAVSLEGESVSSEPRGIAPTTTDLVVEMPFANSTVLLSSRREPAGLSVLVNRGTDPVHARVPTNGFMLRIHENDFKVLVRGVLVDPVRVQDPEIRALGTNSLFGHRLGGSLGFELTNTLVDRLSICGTLGRHSLSVSTADTDPVNDKALFGLVPESSGLVGAGGTGGPVNDI